MCFLRQRVCCCFRCAAVRYRLMQFGGRGYEGFDPSHRSLSSQESAPDRLWMVWTEVPSSDLWPVLCFHNRPVDNEQILMSCALSLDGAGALPTGYAVIEGHPDLKYCRLLLVCSQNWYCDEILMEVISHQVGVDDSGAWQSGAHLRFFGLQ